MHQSRQVAVTELYRRKIDCDAQRPRPRGRLAASGSQNPFAERNDQAAFLGKRHEGAWRHQAVTRMMPARERLETGYLPVDMGLRLIVEVELAPGNRRVQVLLQSALFAQLL